jgi:hypothetical protein
LSTPLLAAIAALAAAAVTASGAPAASTACSPGMHQTTVGGRPAFRFCGTASAVVHVGGRPVRFEHGLCRRAAGAFTVNIGTSVPGLRSGKPPYFGITTHTAKPGKQLNAAVGFAYGGHAYAVADQLVTLAPGLAGGTFSGRILGSTTTVKGSFTC